MEKLKYNTNWGSKTLKKSIRALLQHLNLYMVKSGASLVAQLVKNPPAMQETPVQFLGREDSPGEGIG